MNAHPIDGLPGLFVALIHMSGINDKNGYARRWHLVVGPDPKDPNTFDAEELEKRYQAWLKYVQKYKT